MSGNVNPDASTWVPRSLVLPVSSFAGQQLIGGDSDGAGDWPNHVNVRHTSEVAPGDATYVRVKSDLDGAGLRLLRLLRINNEDLKERFQMESEQLKKMKQKDCNFHLNIQDLYHGSTAPLDTICDEGLDDRLSRKGRFGRGIYFSDNPKKCCQYAKSRSQRPYLLRCQVILGDIKEFPQGEQDESLRREPLKCVSEGKCVYYDSVKGHPADHTEYVVYERRRVLLEYIAFYNDPTIVRSPLRRSARASASVARTSTRSRSRSGSESSSRSGSRTSSPSGSSAGGSPPPSPSSRSQAPVPKVGVRSKSGTKPVARSSSGAASSSSGSSAAVDAVVSETAKHQQRLAFQQMLQLKGNIPDAELNALIKSFTDTYGSIPEPETGPEVITIDEDDDPVSEVNKNLVIDFKNITCCAEDNDQCLRFLSQYEMDLNAAIEAYYTLGSFG